MKIRIEFDTDSAAFDYDAGMFEVKEVLSRVVNTIERDSFGPIRDSNGNRIGKWSWLFNDDPEETS